MEVPVLVDKNGLQPTKIGALPPQLTALMRTNINVQELTVEAALTGKREHIYQAAMMDPHTAAELSLEQIWSLGCQGVSDTTARGCTQVRRTDDLHCESATAGAMRLAAATTAANHHARSR